jgi:hypothetical protein
MRVWVSGFSNAFAPVTRASPVDFVTIIRDRMAVRRPEFAVTG